MSILDKVLFVVDYKLYMPTNISSIKNSKVLVRVNYDLPSLENSERIDDSLATIQTLLEENNKVILCTHWGRPDAKDIESHSSLSTSRLDDIIEEKLAESVLFINQFSSWQEAKEEIDNARENVIILENTRYNSNEKSKDPAVRLELAKKYATLADYFVDEAFAVSHRQEATNTEIKELLPFCHGLSFLNEINNLDKLKVPTKPFAVVMGGAKLETKLDLLNRILPKVDKLIVGGMLCFTFIAAKKALGYKELPEIFESTVETDFIQTAKELVLKYGDKILTPLDFVYSPDGKYAFDIGPKTLELFGSTLEGAKTVFWNGPMGFYEKPPYDHGTLEVGRIIVGLSNAFKVVGGGDTGSALPSYILDGIDFVSMGGGATLEYLSK
jgi:phosphoglycerate kinase